MEKVHVLSERRTRQFCTIKTYNDKMAKLRELFSRLLATPKVDIVLDVEFKPAEGMTREVSRYV